MARPLLCLLAGALPLTAAALTLSQPAAGPQAPQAAPAPSVAAPAAPPLELRIDTSPLGGGRPAPLVLSYADVLEPARKSVVSIRSTRTIHERVPMNPLLRQFFGDVPDQEQEREGTEEGLGAGVIVTANGYILTNNHVVDGFDEVKVTLLDDRQFPARVVGADPKTDVAVLKIEAGGLPAATLADSDKLRVGDIVFAVGNPLGVGQSVTMGIVSAKNKQVGLLDDVEGYENFIQTDAAINLGNSGGALLDARGRLVGINSAIISPNRGNIGIGFAIPVNLAASVMRSLVATGKVSRGFLGVSTLDIDSDLAQQAGLPPNASGAIVTQVIAGSPAARAGLQRSDIIQSVNGQAITGEESLHFAIGQMLPGSRITLQVVRDGHPLTLVTNLGTLAQAEDELVRGVVASPLTDEQRRKLDIDPSVEGLLITHVEKDSPYADRLEENMVVAEINRAKVRDLAGARGALHPGRNLLFVYDGGSSGFVVITLQP